MSPKIKDLISDDPFNQFQYRTTIEYDFKKLEWSYYEFGFFKRTIKPDQWINYDHSMMNDPVYPKLNDRLIFFKNFVTNQYAMDVFSSNWPYRVVVNKGLESVIAGLRPNSHSGPGPRGPSMDPTWTLPILGSQRSHIKTILMSHTVHQ